MTRTDPSFDTVPLDAGPPSWMGPEPEALPPPSGGWVARHWRGDLSLGTSYWLNGALLGNIAPLIAIAIGSAAMASDSVSLRATTATALAFLALSAVAWIWSNVGIWRSARHHVARGGKAGWARAAQVMVVLGVLSVVGRLLGSNMAAEIGELSRIATGNDPMGRIEIEASADGRSLLLKGPIGEGSADKVRAALAGASAPKTLALDSPGGRLAEARGIASEVRRRGIDTYVENLCASACTLIFLAGRDRGATPNARIGFHRASFAGKDAFPGPAGDIMMSAYAAAGLSPAFMARVRGTSSDSIWFPTRSELIDNHVVTRVSFGGETSHGLPSHTFSTVAGIRDALSGTNLWSSAERRFPGTIDRAANAAWAARSRGVNDDQVMFAARSVLVDLMPRALATASDASLEDLLVLVREELAAARALGADACGKFLDSKLNISATLPPAVVRHDLAFSEALFTQPPRADRSAPAPAQLGKAVRRAIGALSPQQLQVVRDPDAFRAQPALRCDSMQAYYGSVAALPMAERGLVLRQMFQSGR